ncbi:hypothetical protein [Pontibacter kalidii]|uniref:hypothetical protein n=1 Tax=Pontibacter kalidii TaxID=2592049 RepID=UPI00224CC322|nr:hypothetical protein [Pontibacter kalidii]
MEEARYHEFVSEEVFRNGFVSILYYEAGSLLTIQWMRQIDFDERREGFLWALDFSIENKVRHWLIDDAEIFVITSQEQRWVENEWTALVATSDISKIAVLLPDHYNSLVAFRGFTQRAQKNYQHHGTARHEVFMDKQTALQWLLGEKEAK